MQRLSGVLMVLAGAALGGYIVLPQPQFGPGKLAEIMGVPAAPIDSNQSVAMKTPTVASAAVAASTADTVTSIVPAVVPSVAPNTVAGVANGRAARVFSPAAPLSPPDPAVATATPTAAPSWSTVVSSQPATQGKLKSSKPGDAETRAVLASDLQRELKRVGCYSGEVTGSWTPSTKRAMSAFMERVNATLPVEEPDYILLTLVQGRTTNACSAECPAGEAQSEAGRCVPKAVVAQAQRKSQRDEERRATEGRKAQQQELLAQEQHAAEAKRLAENRKAADAARLAALAAKTAKTAEVAAAAPTFTAPKQVHAKLQQTAAVEPEKLPWLEPNKADSNTSQPAAATAARGTPPAGMMSVGGPRDAVADVPANATAGAPANEPKLVVAPDVAPPVEAVEAPDPRSAKKKRVAHVNPAPERDNPSAGLPGTKSGVTVRRSVAEQTARPKYRVARIVRRPPPYITYVAPKPKRYYAYAGEVSGKVRRGQPRPGTAHYNLMQSLGGIY